MDIWKCLGKNSGQVSVVATLLGLVGKAYSYFKKNKKDDSHSQRQFVKLDNKGSIGGNVTINYASETTFTESLELKRKNLRESLLIETNAGEKKRILSEIQGINEWLFDPTAAYENQLKEKDELLQQLAVLQNKVEGREAQFIQAQEDLKKGDLATANKVSEDITNDEILNGQAKDLAFAYYSKGIIAVQEIRRDEAAKYFQKAAELNPSIEYLLKASIYLSKVAQYSEAGRFFRLALEKSLNEHGADHLDAATSCNDIAANLESQGKHREAESLLQKALEISRRTLGEEHPTTQLFKKNYEEFLSKKPPSSSTE